MTRGRVQELRDILEAISDLEATEDRAPNTILPAASRTRARRVHNHPRDAATIWEAIVAGAWSLVEHFDNDGHRCFLARRNPHPVPALSERELQIVLRASLGHSNKHIAYELGLCSSTVAAQLTSAARRLGVASREVLLHAFAVLGSDGAERIALGAAATPPIERRAGDPTIRVARFDHDGHDYAVIRIAIAPSLPPSLTAAEAEVAALVVEGLSNAAIAKRRNTSVRTVANQLRSVYSKLSVGSRRQLCSRYSVQAVQAVQAVPAVHAVHAVPTVQAVPATASSPGPLSGYAGPALPSVQAAIQSDLAPRGIMNAHPGHSLAPFGAIRDVKYSESLLQAALAVCGPLMK